MCSNNSVFAYQISSTTLNVLTDFYILAIPIFQVTKLQLTRKRKFLVLAPFMAGAMSVFWICFMPGTKSHLVLAL